MDLNNRKITNRTTSTVSKYNNNKNKVVFYNMWKKYNEIQLTNNKMDFNNRIMINHPTFPVCNYYY